MTSEPTVTVAVATCGRPEALRRCIDAIVAGTSAPDQLVVVDQGPPANGGDVVDRIDPSIPHRYLSQERLGLSASRNLALNVATGDVLAVTDDDIVPDRRWVERIRAAFTNGDRSVSAVTGSVHALEEPVAGETFAISLRVDPEPRHYVGRHRPWTVGTGGNFAARTSVLRDLGGWDDRFGVGSPGRAAEDVELVDRLLTGGHVIAYEPHAVVYHELCTADRRRATRWSYGFGIGAFVGHRLRQRDLAVLPFLVPYLRSNIVSGGLAALRGDWFEARLHTRALVSLLPGWWYGTRLS